MSLVQDVDASLVALEAEVIGEVMRAVGDIERLADDVLRLLSTFEEDASAHHATLLVREALDLVRNARYGALTDIPHQIAEIRHTLLE